MKKIYISTFILSVALSATAGVGDTLWSRGNGKFNREAYSVAFSKDGSKVASSFSCPDAKLRVFDAYSGQILWDTINPNECAQSVCFSSDGNFIAIGEETGHISLWNFVQKKLEYLVRITNTVILSIDVSPDGKHLAVSSWDDSIRIVNITNGTVVLTFGRHPGNMTHIDYSNDGTKILSCSSDKNIIVWDATNGQQLLTLNGHTGTVNCAKFTPDGTQIVSCSKDRTIRFWNAQSGTLLKTISNAHRKNITFLDITNSGQYVATCSEDSTISIWKISDASLFAQFGKKMNEPFNVIDLSPDGTMIVSGSPSGNITMWQTGITTSVENDMADLGVILFPNPTTDHITISSTLPIHFYTIHDISGKTLIAQSANGTNNLQLNVSQWSDNSMYFLTLIYKNGTSSTLKWMKR
jgi:WD40 repeat protein